MLMATMLWGGCLSCAQYFMFPTASAEKCCMPSGECREKQSSQTRSDEECTIQPLARMDARMSLEHALTVVSAVAVLPLQISPTNIALPVRTRGSAGPHPEPAPPDLCLLHSVFRI
jgi:hypothetical protein